MTSELREEIRYHLQWHWAEAELDRAVLNNAPIFPCEGDWAPSWVIASKRDIFITIGWLLKSDPALGAKLTAQVLTGEAKLWDDRASEWYQNMRNSYRS